MGISQDDIDALRHIGLNVIVITEDSFMDGNELIVLIRKYQRTLTEEARLFFWRMIQEEYCEACGAKRDGKKICHCQNDD